jgi:hypothetical protein
MSVCEEGHGFPRSVNRETFVRRQNNSIFNDGQAVKRNDFVGLLVNASCLDEAAG